MFTKIIYERVRPKIEKGQHPDQSKYIMGYGIEDALLVMESRTMGKRVKYKLSI